MKEIYEKILTFNRNNGIIALGFKELKSGFEFYFQKDEVFPAASIIKIPVILEFFRQVEKGKLKFDEHIILKEEDKTGGAGVLFELHSGLELTLIDLARLMIVISDNSATNILLSYTGFDEVNQFMKEMGMTSSALRRKMMVPCESNGENIITVSDIMVLLEKLLKGEILSSVHTGEVINILKRQQYNEKIPLYLPEGVEIAHKTGELQGVRHDVAIIYLPDTIYLLCILTKELKDEIQGDRFIAEISKLIYDNYRVNSE